MNFNNKTMLYITIGVVAIFLIAAYPYHSDVGQFVAGSSLPTATKTTTPSSTSVTPTTTTTTPTMVECEYLYLAQRSGLPNVILEWQLCTDVDYYKLESRDIDPATGEVGLPVEPIQPILMNS